MRKVHARARVERVELQTGEARGIPQPDLSIRHLAKLDKSAFSSPVSLMRDSPR